MNSLRHISRCRNLWHDTKTRLQSTVTASTSEIEIPPRIERGPTDILKALKSTVSRDPLAPHYTFQDDPHLTPLSKLQNRTYAMARESGRKAAMWIHREHADLFEKDIAEPPIQAFLPPTAYTDKTQVSEEILMKLTMQGDLTNALQVYDLLEGQVSNEVKQSLFEMLCFYNGNEPLQDDLEQERWFQRTIGWSKNTWRSHPKATELFEHLITQDAATANAAYNTLICGTAKYLEVEKSWKLYEECKSKNIPLALQTFNYLLHTIPVIRYGETKPIQLAREVCSTMTTQGLEPDINTLNAVLKVAAKVNVITLATDFVRTVFGELKKYQIKPSLASYYYALLVFSKEEGQGLEVFQDILKTISGESFEIRDRADVLFFPTAMDIAAEKLCNREIGDALHNLFLTGDNCKFINSSIQESTYYHKYTILVLLTSTIQEFFEFYRKHVPNIYIPEPKVFTEILKTLEGHPPEAIVEYIPKIWSDLIAFNILDKVGLLTSLLGLARSCSNLPPDSDFPKVFADHAWQSFEFIQAPNQKAMQSISFSATVLADIAILLLRGDYLEQMVTVISFMIDEPGLVIGVMDVEQIKDLFNTCIAQGYALEALIILEYCTKSGIEDVPAMARQLHSSLQLGEAQYNRLVKLIGAEVLELPVDK